VALLLRYFVVKIFCRSFPPGGTPRLYGRQDACRHGEGFVIKPYLPRQVGNEGIQTKPDDFHFQKMNVQQSSKPKCFAMTLIEFIAVIVFIGLLASFFLPLLGGSHRATIPYARMDMKNLEAAISSYDTAYGHLPIADSDTNGDVSFGISSANIRGFQKLNGTRLIASNSDLMIVLLDIDRGVNAGHKLNPQKTVFIEPKRVNDTKSPGVSMVDYQYRDPWGNPYIITLDLNRDNQCRDAVYANAAVSQQSGGVGYNGLSSTNGNGTNFELKSDVMIWSRGPDGKTSADDKANAGVNKDNVLSWQ
jgi:type II secretory pathway pseudopilin PulG